ncbi:ankyrin repeat protein [Biomphalaria glabrata]|nr:ankyrin repeat protein [Biomphalaria glabrata]
MSETQSKTAKRKEKKSKGQKEAGSSTLLKEQPLLTGKSVTKNKWKMFKQEMEKDKWPRCLTNGAGDQALIQSLTTGRVQDIATILQNEKLPCSSVCMNKCLIMSSYRGSKLALVYLISSGTDPNCADEHGNTALMVCALHGFLDMAKLLVCHKADINRCNQDGDTALLLALNEAGATDMVRLLTNKLTVNKKNKNGYSPLMKAIELSNLDTIQMLIEAGALIDDSINGETILEMANKKGIEKFLEIYMESKIRNEPLLICAVKRRDLNLVKTIYVSQPNCLNVQNAKGETALTAILQILRDNNKSITANDRNIIKFLLLNGVDISLKTVKKPKGKKNQQLESPLILAVHTDDPDVISWLCLCGAEVNQRVNTDELTPLMVAAKFGHSRALEALLSAGADIEATCKDGTALDIALTSTRIDVAKLLIETYGKKNPKEAFQIAIERKELKLLEHLSSKFPLDKDIYSILIVALQMGDLNIIKFLSGLGLGEMDNRPLLQGAVKLGKTDLVQALINSSFDVNLRDSVGDTPLHYSCAGDNPQLVRMLLKAGADMNVQNVAGKTSFFVAIERNNAEIIQALLDKETAQSPVVQNHTKMIHLAK